LDLTSEPLSIINQRLNISSNPRSASFTINSNTQTVPKLLENNRSRYNQPLIARTNHFSNSTEQTRTFVHHSDSRPFKLSPAIQMKPMEDFLLSSANGKRRICHRQNALRYKSIDHEQQERISRPTTSILNRIYSSNENSSNQISRHQSIERRQPSTIKSFSFDMNNDLHPMDISWSVREKAKLFEHTNSLPSNRENYV
jgi:hypothetical protein